MDKKRAMKVSHIEEKGKKVSERNDFETYVNHYGADRLIGRILSGRKVKPCGRECREHGLLIAESYNHASFENFEELMDDKDFILEIVKLTPNPNMCENYFYEYINFYLKRKAEFRVEFLKGVYLNENVYKLEDIENFVEKYGMKKENEIVLNDQEFKKIFANRLVEVLNGRILEYHCSGEDKKELHNYKVKANEVKVLHENMKNGLAAILKTFAKEENKETEIEERDDYYAFLCRQAFQGEGQTV